jgi:uncharacterized protein YdhG (YjbR/CyaY superfamily)
MTETKKTTKRDSTASTSGRLSDEEIAAARERAKELKAEARRGSDRAAGERDVLAKIAEMPEADRVIAERIHAIVAANAPTLAPKSWYGMPAYAKDGKVVCFFKSADKFKSRYATFGFEEEARVDDGTMWATSWAITKLTPAHEAKLAALVKKAAG